MADPLLKPVRPEEAIAYFRAKGYRFAPSFDWRDFWEEDHAALFTVAKSEGFDILQDIYDAATDALEQGQTLDDFSKRLTPILQAKGWWGKQMLTDPLTGETAPAQLGSPRRLRIIFDTNLRMAYAAGHWQRIRRLADRRPWLRYVAVMDSRTRPLHRAWHNTVLRWDDPWWDSHYPPNGWNCRCSIQQLSDRDLARFGLKPTPRAPAMDMRPWINRRSGEVMQVPRGVDPGFAYNPGRAAVTAHVGGFYGETLASLGPQVAAQASAAAATYALPQLAQDYMGWIMSLMTQLQSPDPILDGQRKVIGAISPAVLAAVEGKGISLAAGAISISAQDLTHMLRSTKQQISAAVPLADLLRLPQVIASPRAVLWDKANERLLYVFDATGDPRLGKFVVAVNYVRKLPPQKGEPRRTIVTNTVRSAGLVDTATLRDRNSFEVLDGAL